MATVIIMLRQIAIMALLMLVGIYLSRKGFLSEQGTKDLGAILIRIIIPVVIVKSYITAYSSERLYQLGLSFFLALVSYILAMLISYLVFGKKKRIANFAAAFCNAGFIGIPLVQALIGDEGVFFVAASIALLNLFQWTYGVYIMTDNKDAISVKTIAKNPVVIAILIGMILFFTQLPVPALVVSTLGYIAGMNTPVAMILLGTYMAKLPIKRLLLEKEAYLCVLFRLLVIPAVTLFVFKLIPVRDETVMLATFLAAATPVGANICVFAQQNNCDYELSVVTVCLSTLLSAVTVPVLVYAAQMIL
jgi:predicted permease